MHFLASRQSKKTFACRHDIAPAHLPEQPVVRVTLTPAFGSLYSLTGSNLANALTQLSGELATASQQTTFNAMNMRRSDFWFSRFAAIRRGE
jgi:hypothetical protein